MATAEDDSLTMAFFLLKYDFDLYIGKAEAQSAAFENRIADIKADHRRTMKTIVITAIVTGGLFWVGSRVE